MLVSPARDSSCAWMIRRHGTHLDAAVTKDVAGGGDVKWKIWHCEVVEIVRTFHVALAWAEWESDLAVGGGVDQPCAAMARLQAGRS